MYGEIAATVGEEENCCACDGFFLGIERRAFFEGRSGIIAVDSVEFQGYHTLSESCHLSIDHMEVWELILKTPNYDSNCVENCLEQTLVLEAGVGGRFRGRGTHFCGEMAPNWTLKIYQPCLFGYLLVGVSGL